MKQVFSRTESSAFALASTTHAGITTKISEIEGDADFYLVSVSDLALPVILDELKVTERLIFHTAGTFGLDVFKDRFKHCGVLYPLQTFTRSREVDLTNVPILVEGSDPLTTSSILEIAKELSGTVLQMSEDRRILYHLAAVVAANFTNHMFCLASDLLKKQELDFALLHPLMEETLNKALSFDPRNGQTGPAVRGDSNTMGKHLKILSSDPDLQKLYIFISDYIRKYHKIMHSNNDINDKF